MSAGLTALNQRNPGGNPVRMPHGCRILDVTMLTGKAGREGNEFSEPLARSASQCPSQAIRRPEAGIDAADPAAKSACFGVVKSNFEFLSGRYASAASAERNEVSKHASKTIHQLLDSGDWPRALGLTIIMFNLEARHLPGNDAVVLKTATDALIKQAYACPEPQHLRRTG